MRVKTAKFWVLALAVAGMVAGWNLSASATPLDYKESDSGDLTGQNLGALDVGVNKVSGNFTPVVDRDSFAFSLGSGTVVTSFKLFFTSHLTGGVISEVLQYLLKFETLHFGFTIGDDIDLLGASPADPFASRIPLGDPGEYQVSPGGSSGSCSGICSVDVDYTWEITVESTRQVPAPGTLALLGAVLAGLGWSRRRK